MRALAITDAFGIENLQWIQRGLPDPAPGYVAVRMRAVSFNYRDLLVLSGARDIPRPLIPLSDACAVVTAIGAGVTRFAVGDRVLPMFVQGWIAGPQPETDPLQTLGGPLDGSLCEAAVWHEADLVAAPVGLSDAEAATLPCAAVSAWNALFVATSVGPGDTVVIQGTGGVSLFALQLAKLAGARVVLISSSNEKLARGKAMGADFGVNYRERPDWGGAVREALGPVDAVIEVGGSVTLEQSMVCLRNGGHISVVGFLSGAAPSFPLLGELSRKSIRLQGIRVGNRNSFEALCQAVTQHQLRPTIGHVAPFEDAKAALAVYRDAAPMGKICLTFE